MMTLYESARDRQSDLIRQNTASIVITRITRTKGDDGGTTETTANLASQDFRIYNKRSRVLDVDTGGWHSQRIVKMIGKYDCDVQKESAQYLDSFTYGGIKYKIIDVKPMYTQGQIVFKECALEELT
jgi:hypothetical protein